MKRQLQGWIMEVTHDLQQAIDRAQAAMETGCTFMSVDFVIYR